MSWRVNHAQRYRSLLCRSAAQTEIARHSDELLRGEKIENFWKPLNALFECFALGCPVSDKSKLNKTLSTDVCRILFDSGDSRTSSLGNATKCPTPGATLEVGISWQTFFKNHLFRDFFGKRNRCNDGSRCAKCLANQDCASGKVIIVRSMWWG